MGTPQVKRIEPELQVNKYEVEVPVAVPVPVEREVIVEKHVAKPYNVHPVQQVVETPVIDQHHVTVHQPAVAVAHAAPVATYAHAAAPVAAYAHAAAPVAAHTYAAAAPI